MVWRQLVVGLTNHGPDQEPDTAPASQPAGSQTTVLQARNYIQLLQPVDHCRDTVARIVGSAGRWPQPPLGVD